MNQNKTLLVCCLLLILSSTATIAQPNVSILNSLQTNLQYRNSGPAYSSPSWDYINKEIILRSDQPSQSALVSNILSDKAGDMSPVIGAAIWTDSGRQLECRSLLKFNLEDLPEFILEDPSEITSAQLILFPLEVSFAPEDMNRPSKVIIRRVMEYWEDSVASWIDQPSADSSVQVSKVMRVIDKNSPVSVDVTRLVKKMLQSSNNGFLISSESASQEFMASGQLFASPRYGFEAFHPLLIIEYRQLNLRWLYSPVLSGQSLINYQQRELQMNRSFNNTTNQGGNTPPSRPVKQPPVRINIDHQPTPQPPKNIPVKD